MVSHKKPADSYGIRSCAKQIENYARAIQNLEVLRANGFEYDIYEDSPLYEDDDDKIESHLEFYCSLIEDTIAGIRYALN